MSNGNEQVVLRGQNDFSALSGVAKGLKLTVPKLGSLPDLAKVGATVEEKIAAVRETQDNVSTALAWLKNVRRKLAEQAGNRLAIKIVREETGEDVRKMNQYLDGVLSLEDSIFKQAAGIAYMKSTFSGDLVDLDEADEVLRDLENRGLLVGTGNEGPIIIGYKHYKVASCFGMEQEDLDEVGGVIAQFSQRRKALVHQQRQIDTKRAQESANINLDQARDGETGRCFLDVPPEQYMDGNQERWRGGGKLLVEFTEQEVIPLLGVGSIERLIEDMVKTNVRLLCHALKRDTPPATGRIAFEKMQDSIMYSLGLSSGEAEAYVNRTKAFWWILRRAVNAWQDKKDQEQLKEELKVKVTITMAQFYGLGEGAQVGTACLEFEGMFRPDRGPSIANLFLLVNASMEGETRMIEVAALPEHLENLLGDVVGKKFPAGDDFSHCPVQLGRVLRGIRGHVEMVAEVTQGQVEN